MTQYRLLYRDYYDTIQTTIQRLLWHNTDYYTETIMTQYRLLYRDYYDTIQTTIQRLLWPH
jgi:hypothetical protein